MSTIAVPEIRSGCDRTGEMKTRRFVCDPSGAFTIVASLWFVLSVSRRVASGPPEFRARSPGTVVVAPPRRKMSVFCVSGSGKSAWSSKTFGATSIIARGSLMIPFGMPWSQ